MAHSLAELATMKYQRGGNLRCLYRSEGCYLVYVGFHRGYASPDPPVAVQPLAGLHSSYKRSEGSSGGAYVDIVADRY